MSQDTFECRTFSKKMGEDSEVENSEEDLDEMIMNMNYFQKQNKSSEPSVIHDPLVLDHTTMNENTIMLIRNIEANLNSKIIQKSENHALTNLSHQCQATVSSPDKNTIEFMHVQQNGNANINKKLSKEMKILATSNSNTVESMKVQQENVGETSQQIIVIDDESHPLDVETFHIRKKMKVNDCKSFLSPGNTQVPSIKCGNQSKPKADHIEISIGQNKNHAREENFQDPYVVKTNTNRLLRDIAKDIEEYKSRALTKLGKPLKPPNKFSSVTERTHQQEAELRASMMKKGSIVDLGKQKGMNQKQKEPSKKGNTETKTSRKDSEIKPSKFKCKECHDDKFKCKECQDDKPDVHFCSRNALISHQKELHPEKCCELCNMYFQVTAALVSHNSKKHGLKPGPKFIKNVDTHELVLKDSGIEPRMKPSEYKGEECLDDKLIDVHFPSWNALITHQKELHPEKCCEICNTYFQDSAALFTHDSKKHGMKLGLNFVFFQCQDCSKTKGAVTFSTKIALLNHQKEKHPEKFCKKCDKYFQVSTALVSHNLKAHGVKLGPKFTKTVNVQCQDCFKMKHTVTFPSKKALLTHQKEKHPEKCCKKCDKYFQVPAGLIDHKNAKHGQKIVKVSHA